MLKPQRPRRLQRLKWITGRLRETSQVQISSPASHKEINLFPSDWQQLVSGSAFGSAVNMRVHGTPRSVAAFRGPLHQININPAPALINSGDLSQDPRQANITELTQNLRYAKGRRKSFTKLPSDLCQKIPYVSHIK